MEKEALRHFYDSLVEFLALSKQQMVKIAADHDLTPMQALVLLRTREDAPTMHSLGAMLGCDASNVTGIVDGLERKQLLTRAEHPSDRRVKILRLLPKGVEARKALLDQYSDRNTSYILSKLTADEVKEFTRLVQKITAGAGCPQSKKDE